MPHPRLRALLLPALFAISLLAGCASEGDGGVQSQKLNTIRGRGKLICGVDGKLPGFSFVGPDGRYTGLDVDICRAVAAAVLGDPNNV
ncbi:MAG: amino acid ABC transporter substrate-binding protein, partial [Vulcanococcus sp.]